ncbi:MAG: hypothetical protein UX22_C0022G0001, partial [Candidatus Jorgensenbacteria bacterium GW2011_GWA2_45_9]
KVNTNVNMLNNSVDGCNKTTVFSGMSSWPIKFTNNSGYDQSVVFTADILDGVSLTKIASAVPGGIKVLAGNPPSINVSKSPSLGNTTYATGENNVKVAEFILAGSNTEDVKINSITWDVWTFGISDIDGMQNLSLWDGATRLDFTVQKPYKARDVLWINNGLTLAKNSSKTLSVRADIVSAFDGLEICISDSGIAGYGVETMRALVKTPSLRVCGQRISSIASAKPSTTITSPVGGETWKVGETHRIAWKSSNVSNVKLYLYDDRIPSSGAIVAYPAGGNSIPAVQGYYDWAIPNSILQGNDGKHFQIKIQDANDYRLYDSSNGYFTIVSATTAANVSLSYDSSTPVSANTIADSKGVSLVNYRISVNNGVFNLPTITLDLDTSKASVSDISTISIYKSGSLIGRGEFTATGRVVLNLSTIIPNGISQVWEVKADISPSAVPGHQISLGSPNLTFATQAEFNFTQVPIGWSNPMTIISTPSITTPSIIVLSPNGGELWEAGKTYEIKWISSPAGYLVSLSLVKKGETILTHIEGFLSNNNSYYWTAPSNLTIGEYKIMATLSDKIGTFDKSDNYFSIVSAATQSSITVVSPNGGEVWRVGETNVIKWKISGFAEPIDIRIDLYDDINLQTYPIAEVVASPLVDGSFSWAIPSSATTVEGRNLPITPGNKFRIVMFAERTSNGVKQQFRGESGHFTIGSSGIGSNNNGTSANLPLSASVIESMSSALSQLKAIFEGMR